MIANVVVVYSCIPNSGVLDILKKQYEKYPNKKVSTEDIGKMADIVLKNYWYEFDSNFYKKISRTGIGTKFTPPYACISMIKPKRNFERRKI